MTRPCDQVAVVTPFKPGCVESISQTTWCPAYSLPGLFKRFKIKSPTQGQPHSVCLSDISLCPRHPLKVPLSHPSDFMLSLPSLERFLWPPSCLSHQSTDLSILGHLRHGITMLPFIPRLVQGQWPLALRNQNHALHSKLKSLQPGMVAHVCDLSALETKAGGLPRVQGQSGPHSETLFQN